MYTSINEFNHIIGNDVIYKHNNPVDVIIYDFFNRTCRIIYNKNESNAFPILWNYGEPRGQLFISLMFYIRNFRKKAYIINNSICHINNGRCEKMLSYNMSLWLLKNKPLMFTNNHMRFIHDMGCYKDCLVLSKMASARNYSNNQIHMILLPMATSLINDSKIIDQITNQHISQNANDTVSNLLSLLSLASKWAPREGKLFNEFIPQLKQLCGITGPKSNMLWRKYIQKIVKHIPTTIESNLSKKKYNNINFKTIPQLAKKKYRNTFMNTPELRTPYMKYLNNPTDILYEYDTTNAHDLLNRYLPTMLINIRLYNKDIDTENKWKNYIDTAINSSLSLDRAQYNFIPIIDMSESMSSIKNALYTRVAIVLGITMGIVNTGVFNRKSITFSSTPILTSINGDTAYEQINSLRSAIEQPNAGSKYSMDICSVFDTLLTFILFNKTPQQEVTKLKLVIFTDKPFNKNTQKQNYIDTIRVKYVENGYTPPQIIYWNLHGDVIYNTPDTDVDSIVFINGFDSHIIDHFLDSGLLNTSSLPMYILSQYTQLVASDT
jgi:hypothetical protein